MAFPVKMQAHARPLSDFMDPAAETRTRVFLARNRTPRWILSQISETLCQHPLVAPETSVCPIFNAFAAGRPLETLVEKWSAILSSISPHLACSQLRTSSSIYAQPVYPCCFKSRVSLFALSCSSKFFLFSSFLFQSRLTLRFRFFAQPPSEELNVDWFLQDKTKSYIQIKSNRSYDLFSWTF